MAQKYISPSNTFSFEYPDDWKLEREDGGTLKLFRKSGIFKKTSQNILRIVPIISDSVISPETYFALLSINKKEHKDLQVIEKSDSYTMNFHILKYRKENYQDIEDRTYLMVQDFRELIISNRIFKCSFSVKKDDENSPQSREEKEISENILYSLKLL